ncbi:hypothetical protein [Parasitella parasitica]|uniref:Integrase catalytic domain-containing protein n=1 Tax=Parasitella parasitica TaxID=35722 RepID=A0A0B7N6J0_9FUNG|nr:hypothetical protein [Parasitella parasitica]
MMAGWIDTLLDFHFEVIHLPGAMNIFPDLLSRLYPPIENKNTQLLLEESEAKSKLRSKRNFARRKDGKMVRKVKYSQDRSLNIFATQVVENKKEGLDYMTPLDPDADRDGILQEIHQFGHLGAQAIVREVHFQGLHWEMSLIWCKYNNCSVDLAGPLTPTLDGYYVYVMVVTDICTKYIIVRPLKTKESTSVARELIKVFGDYSFPIVLQSDQLRVGECVIAGNL